MAIIYTYPDKTAPSLLDKVTITDVSSTPVANQTKSTTIQAIADAMSGQFTLQEVLNTGSSASGNAGSATWTGNMSLNQSGSFIAPIVPRKWIVDLNGATGSGSNKTAYLIGDMQIASNGGSETGDLDISGDLTVGTNGNIAGDLNMTGLSSDVILNGGNFTATTGKQTKFQASTAVGGGFTFDTNGNATAGFAAGTVINKLNSVDFQVEGFFTVNSANATTGDISLYAGDDLLLRGDDITLQANSGSGHILDLGNYSSSSNRFDEVNIGAEDIIRVRTYNGNARVEFNGATGSVNYFSALDITTGNELRLAGASGTAGQVLKSEGVGNNPTWADAITLIPLPSTQIYTGDASNSPVATNFITVDVPNNDITLGTNATQTLVSGGARYNTDAGTGTGLGSGNANIQFGREAMAQVYGAGTHTSSGLNLAIGNEALMGNVGVGAACSGNTAVGWQAMKNQDMANTDLINNVALGSAALRGGAVVGSNCGGDNVAIGRAAIQATTNVSARRNVGVGAAALTALTTAEGNTAVGYLAGTIQATGNSNTLIGAQADGTTNACEEGVAVGKSAKVDTQSIAIGGNAAANVVNSVAIGHDSSTQGIGSVALGKGAVNTAPNTVTINVSNINGPAAFGGLQPAGAGAGTLPPLLTPGDLYYIPPGVGGNVTSHNLLAIAP